MSAIELRHVTKVFGRHPERALALLDQGASKAQILEKTQCVIGVADVSLNVEAGEVFVIMGLSGSGKSTLVRHLNRLIDPSRGEIIVQGENVLGYGPGRLRELRRRQISMVFQGFGLLPHKNVVDNVAYGLRVRGEPSAASHERAHHWIEQVGLAGYAKHWPEQLSGGMRQRVGLARALASDTPILLLDEAFSALDPLIRADLQEQLRSLQAKLHKTIVFITHDLDEALRLGDRIAIMRDGRLVQVGTPEHILQHPADDYVSRFVQRRTGV